MCSACHLIVFNICVKFHENMSSSFKVMEQTQKLLTDTHKHRKDENYNPIALHTSYAELQFMCSACCLMVKHLCEVS